MILDSLGIIWLNIFSKIVCKVWPITAKASPPSKGEILCRRWLPGIYDIIHVLYFIKKQNLTFKFPLPAHPPLLQCRSFSDARAEWIQKGWTSWRTNWAVLSEDLLDVYSHIFRGTSSSRKIISMDCIACVDFSFPWPMVLWDCLQGLLPRAMWARRVHPVTKVWHQIQKGQ